MELAPAVPLVADLETELLAAYPALARRLALVLRDSDEAEDVAQEAFARALANRHRFHGGDARAWFYTIGLRLCFNEIRRRRSHPTSSLVEQAWAMETDPDLWMALDHLHPHHRAALVLNVLDGYTHDEIAQMLDVRPGTVSSWLSRARVHLRSVLSEVKDE